MPTVPTPPAEPPPFSSVTLDAGAIPGCDAVVVSRVGDGLRIVVRTTEPDAFAYLTAHLEPMRARL